MKKILTFGVFDYFHLGHLRLFKQCKQHADYLIVAVQDERYVLQYKPEANLLYSTDERVEILEALRVVDEVVVYDIVNTDTLGKIDFDILALGEDHVGERFDKLITWCQERGKDVVRLKRTAGVSSTSIKQDIHADIHAGSKA